MPAPMVPVPITAMVCWLSNTRLPSFKARRALLEEGRDALLIVAREPRLPLRIALVIELRIERIGPARLQRALDGGESLGRLRQKLTDYRIGRLAELVVLDRL